MFNNITFNKNNNDVMYHVAVARSNECSMLHSVDSSAQTTCILLESECISRKVAYRIHAVISHFSSAKTGT